MAFPHEPLIATPYDVPSVDPTVFPVPTWATSTIPPPVGPGIAVKTDPGVIKRELGWTTASPSVDYGEAPPFAWENHERYLNGQWATYFKAVADYLKTGNFSPSVVMAGTTNTVPIPPALTTAFSVNRLNYFNYGSYPPWDGTNNQILAPFSGFVRLDFSCAIYTPNPIPSSDALTIEWVKNGGSADDIVVETEAYDVAINQHVTSFSGCMPVTINDVIKINVTNPYIGVTFTYEQSNVFSLSFYKTPGT